MGYMAEDPENPEENNEKKDEQSDKKDVKRPPNYIMANDKKQFSTIK
jgi:hypothetical protein